MFIDSISISQENFEIMQPIMIVSRLFGLFPIKYSKHGAQYRLRWSLGYGIYSYLLCIILTTLTLLGVANDLNEDEMRSIRMKDKKNKYVTCCDMSIVMAIVVFSTVALPFKLKQFWKMLQHLNVLDTIIPIKGQNRFRRASVYFMASLFLLFFLILAFDNGVWAYGTLKNHTTTDFFKNYISFYLLYCILVMQEVFFWHIVFFIKIRISLLNKTLRSMEDEKADMFHKKSFGQAYPMEISLKSSNVKTVEYLKQDGGQKCAGANVIEQFNIAERVVSLIKFQEKVSAAVESINSCLAYGIPLIMLSCLLHLIVTPYFLLTEIMKNGNAIFITLQSFWLLIHIGRVLIIVEPCQLCLNEHLRTSVIVYELLTCRFEEEEKKALTTFAMQLSYCRLKFTSGGFFKIDRSLLTSVAGAVTTYLVILFQFNN
nr:gustatory receptor [Semanotus bifasciatus]